MAPLRAFVLLVSILFFFFVAAPVQALLARRRSSLAALIPKTFCRWLLAVLRVSLEVEGGLPARGPVLYAVNHVSWIDILVLGSLTPFCFLAKREVATWPILSTFAEVQGTVFVDRSRRRGIPPANRQMAARMAEGRAVLLFPEGTTFDGVTLGRFHSSHFAAARDLLRQSSVDASVTVQPVALAYSAGHAAWIGDDSLLPHLWRVLRRGPMRCLVAFGAPIAYGLETDRKAVAGAVRQSIVALLDDARARRPAFDGATLGSSAAPAGEQTVFSGIERAAAPRVI